MSLSVHIRKKLHTGMLDVNLDSESGVAALLGETGSGKTTVLRCIAGLETPDEGHIELDGRVLYDSLKRINLPPRKRGVGMLGGSSVLRSNLTVEENLRRILRIRSRGKGLAGRLGFIRQEGDERRFVRVSGRKRRLIVAEKTSALLCDYELDGFGGRYPGELTPQQSLMTQFACVMAGEPELLLLDEPFRGLDPFLRAQMLYAIRSRIAPDPGSSAVPAVSEAGAATVRQAVFASADRDEVYAMSGRILAMERGVSQPVKEKKDFFAAPVTISAALLSGCRNVTEAVRLDDHHVYAPAWGAVFLFPEEKGEAPAQAVPAELHFVGIRETDFVRSRPEEDREKEYFRFTVHIRRVEDTLTDWRVWFTGGRSEQELMWQVPKTGITRSQIDSVKRLYIPADRIMRLK